MFVINVHKVVLRTHPSTSVKLGTTGHLSIVPRLASVVGMQKQMHVISNGFVRELQICPEYSFPVVNEKEDFGHFSWQNGSGVQILTA